ncbi:hypothetical protein PQR68_07910 [Paraburkholderia agricolaris]|jgi:hypothetical protein|uniref:hypothetical protein n=1 Tax=Paraburkholderia agricolaris TaxID=2152888 RepID=UPI001291B994|nr:hypothetical protein [Paraburkholderia agricolaris]
MANTVLFLAPDETSFVADVDIPIYGDLTSLAERATGRMTRLLPRSVPTRTTLIKEKTNGSS